MGGVEAAKDGSAERLCATDAAKAYKRGLALCGEGSYDKALTLFDEAIAFRVDCSHYFAARANCKQAMGEHMDAYHDYVSAIRLNHTKCAYFSCRGLCLLKIGKLEAALSDFSKACELEPGAAVYHYQKASLLHHHLARPGAAVVSYGECLANTRSSDSAMTLRCLYAKGSCLLEEGRAVEAVEDLSRAVEISNPSPSSLHYFAKALKEVGREEQALEVLGEAIDKWSSAVQDGRPSDSGHELFLDRGVLRLNRGDDAGAVSDFDEAVAFSGGARGGYFVQRARARARVAMRSHGREDAVAGLQDIEKAMDLEPGNTEFLFTAGVLCSRMGEYDQALGHLQRLRGVYEDRAAAARSRACAEGAGGGGAESKGEQAGDAESHPASPRESDAPGVKDPATSPAACEFEMALCLYKLGRPLEALRLAEQPALASWCLQDARQFQLRGLIKHDLGRFGEAVKDFTASIAIDGQKPEGFLLRGRSLAGQSRHERAVDDFSTALYHLKPDTEPRRASAHEESAAADRNTQNHFSGDSRRSNSSPRENDDGGGGDHRRSLNLATNTSEGMPESNSATIHDEYSTTFSDTKYQQYGYDGNTISGPTGGGAAGGEDGHRRAEREPPPKNQEYGYGNTSGPAGGNTAGVQDGHHRAERDPSPDGANASGRVSRGSNGEDGMVEWGSVAGACHYARALSLQQLGRYEDAAQDFDEAVAEGPISWQRLWHRAICLAELGEAFRVSAARDLRDCLSMAKEEQIPEMPHFLFQVGLAFLRLGDSSTALTNFYRSREAVKLPLQLESPRSSMAREEEDGESQPLPGVREEQFEASLHYHIGVCLAKSGDLVRAEDEFSSAIACPNGQATSGVPAGSSCSDEELRAAFHCERGKARQLLRNFKGARSDFTTCLGRPRPPSTGGIDANESSPHDARTLFRRGWANKALGKLVEAAADFEAARLMEPSHPSLSVDYRNIFEIELVVVDDIESVTQSPALFHNW